MDEDKTPRKPDCSDIHQWGTVHRNISDGPGILSFLDCRFKAELRAIADSTRHIAKAFGEENAR